MCVGTECGSESPVPGLGEGSEQSALGLLTVGFTLGERTEPHAHAVGALCPPPDRCGRRSPLIRAHSCRAAAAAALAWPHTRQSPSRWSWRRGGGWGWGGVKGPARAAPPSLGLPLTVWVPLGNTESQVSPNPARRCVCLPWASSVGHFRGHFAGECWLQEGATQSPCSFSFFLCFFLAFFFFF